MKLLKINVDGSKVYEVNAETDIKVKQDTISIAQQHSDGVDLVELNRGEVIKILLLLEKGK